MYNISYFNRFPLEVNIKKENDDPLDKLSRLDLILEKIKKTGTSIVPLRVEKLTQTSPSNISNVKSNITQNSSESETYINSGNYSILTIEPNITDESEELRNEIDTEDLVSIFVDDDDTMDNEIENYDNDPDYDSSADTGIQINHSTNKTSSSIKKASMKVVSQDYPTYDMPSLAYVCANCRGRFSSQELLEQHMQEGGDCHNLSLTCKECGRLFDSKKKLSRHVDSIHRAHPNYKCDVCKRNYSNEELLMAHLAMCNGDFEDNSGILYKCKECDLQFISKRELFDHIAQHPVRFSTQIVYL